MQIKHFFTVASLVFSICALAQKDTTLTPVAYAEFTEDFRITDLIERYSNTHKGKPIDGFRIQLYSGDRSTAKQIRKEGISKFPEVACILDYEAPDYKVQIGNYRTELEAEKMLQHVRKEFQGAFIAKSKIDLPPLRGTAD